MGKLISTHIEARWTIPGPSSSKSRGARQRGRVLLAASPAAVLGFDKTDHRAGIPSRTPTRRNPKAKTT
jgi:hypothetical protein